MSDVWRVAGRELRTQTRTKGFVISLLVSALVVAALVAVPQLLGSDEHFRVGVAGAGSERLAPVLYETAAAAGVAVDVDVHDPPQARTAVADGDLDAAVVDSRRILVDGEVDDQLEALLQQAHATVAGQQRLAEAGVDPHQLRQALDVDPLAVESVTGDAADTAQAAVALLVVIILFFLIIGSAMMVAMGVVEEKGSRIVEILLVAVRPWQLLAGKIVAFGVLGVIQLVTFAVVALATAAVLGALPELPAGTPAIIAAALVGFLFGFVFYAAVAAALASLVSRQEEVSHVLSPLTLAIIASYLVGIWAATSPGTTIAQALSMIPPFAAMVMPVRVATMDVPLLEIAVAFAAMAAATAAVLAAGGRIYERAVLRTGARIRLRDAWRSAR